MRFIWEYLDPGVEACLLTAPETELNVMGCVSEGIVFACPYRCLHYCKDTNVCMRVSGWFSPIGYRGFDIGGLQNNCGRMAEK